MSRFVLIYSLLLIQLINLQLFAQTPQTNELENWVNKSRKYFYDDPSLSSQYLDSIKIQLIEKTDTAIYWTARYKSELSYRLAVHLIDYDSTIKTLQESLSLYRKLGKESDMAGIESRIGTAYLGISLYDSALFYVSNGLEKNQLLGNDSRANRGLGDMFIVYFYKAEYEQALDYIRQHVQKSIQLGDTAILPQAYLNLAATFYRLNEHDSSKKYHFQSLEWAKINGRNMDIAYSYLNLGEIYSNENQLDSAVYYLKRSQDLFQELNFRTGLNSNSLNLAKVLLKKNQYDEALSLVKNSIQMSEEAADLALLRDALDIKLVIDKKRNSYEKALGTLERINQIQDSLDNQLNKASMDELITKYETRELAQKVEIQDAKLSEQIAIIQRNRIVVILSFVALTFLILIGLLWRNRLEKKQKLRLQEAKLAQQEAEIKATISSQEKERTRFARDLHDGFGQMISVLNLNLKSLEENPKPVERQKVFDTSSEVISNMYDELKSICFDLMPQTLINQGLKEALIEFSNRLNTSNQIKVEVNVFGLEQRLLEVQEISLYRICQEWVNNIMKYSDASELTLQITRDEMEITLIIEDNGSGFDRSLLTMGKGNGWKNLNSRSNLIKGQLELETMPGKKGNSLIINAPANLNSVHQSIPSTISYVEK